jgi:methionyl-tRNA formyltransferase
MRILFLGNSWVGWHIVSWLKEQGEEIVGCVIHPPEKRKYGEEIINSAGVTPPPIFDGSLLHHPETVEAIKRLRADIGISAFFGYIVRQDILNLLPAGCLNIHPALLPYNRGAFPNVWSIIEGTPAGATIHYMDASVDTGDIVAQQPVPVTPIDTGGSLYRKLELACVELFVASWPLIRSANVTRTPQDATAGCMHRSRDIESIDEIDLDRTYKARELINILRARTFPPYSGAYFREDGRKIFLSLELKDEATPEGN